MESVYFGLLKSFDRLGVKDKDIEFVYQFEDERLNQVREQYGLDEIAGNGTDFEKAYQIMKWIYSILVHDPNYENQPTDNAATLLKRLVEGKPINCRATATVFVEIMLALKIKARSVWLLPANPYDTDCHVLPMVYCSELQKWVLFDATVDSLVYDEENHPLNQIEIRSILAEQGNIKFSDTVRYIRKDCSYTLQARTFKQYLAKNSFYFKTYEKSCFGFEGVQGQRYIYLRPDGFDVVKQNEVLNEIWDCDINNGIPIDFCTLASFFR